jgi:hypothetical protein
VSHGLCCFAVLLVQREEETALAAHLRAQGVDVDPSLHDGDLGGSYEEGDDVSSPVLLLISRCSLAAQAPAAACPRQRSATWLAAWPVRGPCEPVPAVRRAHHVKLPKLQPWLCTRTNGKHMARQPNIPFHRQMRRRRLKVE